MSLLDFLSERIVPLVKYLDRKMVKYSVTTSSAGSYVKLVRKSMKSKATATDGVTQRIETLKTECAETVAAECAIAIVSLQE